MKEKAAYLRGLIEGLGIDETTKEGKVIKAMSELLGELAEAVDGIDEDVTRAYDQINDLSEELEDLEADLYEDDEDDEEPEEEEEDTEEDDNDDDIASGSDNQQGAYIRLRFKFDEDLFNKKRPTVNSRMMPNGEVTTK